MTPLVLSLFPGIDLLGRAFEEVGFCVVKGPDLITGGDIRNFTPPPGRFEGVIGGPPCQDFSSLNRNQGDYGHEMLDEFVRVIEAADPRWYLFENVVRAPRFSVSCMNAEQRFQLDLAWFSEHSRRRDFQFGSKSGLLLNPMYSDRGEDLGPMVSGQDERPFRMLCGIHGLPDDFDLDWLTVQAKKQAIANSVPMQLGTYVAELIQATIYGKHVSERARQSTAIRGNGRRCKCGCGRVCFGRQLYALAACRKRAQRARERECANL